MKNTNTRLFWNRKNNESESLLQSSPIYLDKNKIVLKWLKNNSLNLLNIGIGNGYLEDNISIYRPKINLHGIDISDASVRSIKKLRFGKFYVANVTKIPFESNLFDVVVSLDILEHLTTQQLKKGINEIKRVLRHNGLFIVSVPINENKSDKLNNRHIIDFTVSRMNKLFLSNGFEIIEIKELYAFHRLYLLKSLIAKLLKVRKPNLLVAIGIKK